MRRLDAIVSEVRRAIAADADPSRAEGERRYFKETIRNRGLSVPKCQAIARAIYREHKLELSQDEWFAIAEELLASGWHEEGTVGLELVRRSKPEPSTDLFERYERWLGAYVGNWAHCDELCTHLLGDVISAKPALVRRLKPWTASKNRWLLKEAARQHRPEVTAFLEQNVRRMPRTAFRYAIELFPPNERERLMSL